jgi:hypothetical protein
MLDDAVFLCHNNFMTLEHFKSLFDDADSKYLDFSKVNEKLSNRPDLNAFLLLDNLQPGSIDIVGSSSHDEFYLGIDVETLAESITEQQVYDLISSGVLYNSSYNSLYLFT